MFHSVPASVLALQRIPAISFFLLKEPSCEAQEKARCKPISSLVSVFLRASVCLVPLFLALILLHPRTQEATSIRGAIFKRLLSKRAAQFRESSSPLCLGVDVETNSGEGRGPITNGTPHQSLHTRCAARHHHIKK